ncbi:hypothetical protein B0H13DRAFT_1875140 [Mycena leptocephala]|nr:hypothetical protein B0H13DRAFT_1875140 [Mycena leptocephala]
MAEPSHAHSTKDSLRHLEGPSTRPNGPSPEAQIARRHVYYKSRVSSLQQTRQTLRSTPTHLDMSADKSLPKTQNDGPIPASGTFYPTLPASGGGSQETPKPVPLGLYQTHLRKSAARRRKPRTATYTNGGDNSIKDLQSGSKGS